MGAPGKHKFEFPVGYEKFHNKQLFNFQLNRPYAFGYARLQDMREAGRKISSFSDWKREMLGQAEKAVSEGRLLNAAFYFRAAEFYTKSDDPDKSVLYDKFIDLFYTVFEEDEIEEHIVPYEGAYLVALRIPAAVSSKGTVVIHGGFDSFIEEFYSMMTCFSSQGYDVIGFEGPGQGASLRKFGLPLTLEWEKPVKTILDYFQLEEVTLIGISMGGWLCLRASAFEPRIKRVIATGHAIDYMKSMPSVFRKIHLWCMNHYPVFMNRMAALKFERRDGMAAWMVDQLKYITRKSKPLDALDVYVQMNEGNIHSELVRQYVLILTGRNDHFIPFKMHDLQLRALVNAKSVTGRVFAEEEHAQNHCQIGNIGLALETMIAWMDTH
ncbi:alpha/beta hydrolase [Gaoshiqia sediminis]|uniref:Alpha/beta hydrolase n=1 Tax=Gaoshiqia sediminis TaxID=2986998 RepID=A0AA41Y9C4_9BACT|nr:alpha/beta fold hydrolase [Gaoshiqia sediminis]MCW0483637.1 alpha/beta hydrolase [Gaoshiqia sediminis]